MAKSTTPARKSAATKAAPAKERQVQAAAPAAPKGRRMARPAPEEVVETKPAGTGRGRGSQKQATAAPAVSSKQGASTSGKIAAPKAPPVVAAEPIRAGTKNVLIEFVPMPKAVRKGRPETPEEYPFGALQPSTMKDKEIIGPSFFIPEEDNPARHIAAARKRHKGALFWVRKVMGQVNGKGPMVPGRRVWRGEN